MLASYYEGLTSGIWINPNNQLTFWLCIGGAFFWTLGSIYYMVSIIPPLKIWKFTQGYDVESILQDARERREAERLCLEEEIGCDELNDRKEREAREEAERLCEEENIGCEELEQLR